ncbi:MAG: hypothetical protein KDC05_09420 [Bacteroidales bacterium]|nr:hypothetical protein [Bacteroidales bacterium]
MTAKIQLILFLIFCQTSGFSQMIHHEIHADLDIQNHTITVTDEVKIPATMIPANGKLIFSLNTSLEVSITDENIELTQESTNEFSSDYSLVIEKNGSETFTVPFSYSGVINDQIEENAAAVARGFSETSGLITADGVYLGGSTLWLPDFEEPLFTFNLEVTLPSDWSVVSQGKRTQNEISGEKRTVRYESPNPDEEAYLIAAHFTEYEQMAGNIAVQAFLRTPDEELANRYIGVTAQYIEMYENLVGAYPYTKFALVENFWETGFGMPSFTLLGEKVIRLPFILYTSYPHELLHNWWGNSVYVDVHSGNWCEGITAYMADHLMKEQQGQGAQYRQTTLQKFTDYVNENNDFPLIEFRSRHNSAEEAVGYGKCLMMNHMLRKEVGDSLFKKAYQHFYQNNKFTIASYMDIRKSFEEVTRIKLEPFFSQWTERKGAPALSLSDVTVKKEAKVFKTHFTLEQTQSEDPFFINVPVAIYSENSVVKKMIAMDLRKQKFTLHTDELPVKIEIDPQFDVFRKLDKAEVPPALSQLFGSRDAKIILPAKSSNQEAYRELAETWQKSQEVQGKKLQIVLDSEIDELPEDQSVWVIGFENKFADQFLIAENYATSLGPENVSQILELSKSGSLVYAVPNPGNNAYSLGFIGTNIQEAIPGLARLLPHYGKYSYLGFEGTRPNNVLKGNFPSLNSPLHQIITFEGKTGIANARLEPEEPLIN